MICSFCQTATVTWRGPLSALTHTECSRCGRVNCQQVEPAAEDDDVAAVDIAHRALREIAAGRFINANGHKQRYSREALIQIAREVCVEMKLSFDVGGERS